MPSDPLTKEKHDRRALVLKAVLLVVMVLVSFVACFFARDLSFTVFGWPFHFWLASQGAVLAFIGIVAVYAWAMNRIEAEEGRDDHGPGGDGGA
jgi:putative solute:sodium symporter small subunit